MVVIEDGMLRLKYAGEEDDDRKMQVKIIDISRWLRGGDDH